MLNPRRAQTVAIAKDGNAHCGVESQEMRPMPMRTRIAFTTP
jgi:hypothetical protein